MLEELKKWENKKEEIKIVEETKRELVNDVLITFNGYSIRLWYTNQYKLIKGYEIDTWIDILTEKETKSFTEYVLTQIKKTSENENFDVYAFLEEKKERYENQQTFEEVRLGTIPLSKDKTMISFHLYGENGKNLSLFSFVVRNDTLPLRLIASQGNVTYTKNDLKQLDTDIEDIMATRIRLLKEYGIIS